jgi:hydroxysqualene synthase
VSTSGPSGTPGKDGQSPAVSVQHYENFPVASWLCPPALRPPITAIYWFARTADDLADEGTTLPAQRHADLRAYRTDLHRVAAGLAASERWRGVFEPLSRMLAQHQLPPRLLDDLLTAFIRDIDNPIYPDRDAVLDYCRYSANPIGRLLLHLYGVQDEVALRQSDAVCSALQLINFWQDLSVDLPRGRHYIPNSDLRQHQVPRTQLQCRPPSAAHRSLLLDLVGWSRRLMLEGAPLVHRLPGRMGWELRLVVQGGLRVLEKIEAMDETSFVSRPTVAAADAPLLLWRALWMPRS